jgi:SAM-dependent methyltransferase
MDEAARLIASPRARRLGLDVGCGTGLSARALRRLTDAVVGTDVSLPMLRHARPAEGVTYVTARAEAISARDAAFDVASIGCAFHWCDAERPFAESSRVLRPGGWLLIFDCGLQGFSDGSREPVDRLAASHWSTLPPCPRHPYLDPRRSVPAPLAWHASSTATATVRMSAHELVDFVCTQATTLAAAASGHASMAALRERAAACLAPAFPGSASKELRFGGPLPVLRRGSGDVPAAACAAGSESARPARSGR